MRRIALVVVVLVAGSVLAHAQPKPEGTRLFEEGRELAKDGKYAEACDRFSKSFEIERAPGTALNYGDCLEKLGKLRASWELFETAARDFENAKDERAKFARDRANAVGAKLATIVVRVSKPGIPGMLVKIADQSLPARAEHSDRFEPGEVTVVATAPGHEPFSTSVTGVAGANLIVQVPALRPTAEVGPDAPIAGRRNPARVRVAFGVGAAGGVALIVSGVVGLSARALYNDTVGDPSKCSTIDQGLRCTQAGANDVEAAATRANIATGVAVVGGVLVATGIILYVTAPREGVSVTPMASASTIGLALGGRF